MPQVSEEAEVSEETEVSEAVEAQGVPQVVVDEAEEEGHKGNTEGH